MRTDTSAGDEGVRHMDIAAVQLPVPQLADAQRRAATAAPSATVLAPPHISLGYPWRHVPPADLVQNATDQWLPLTVRLGPPMCFPTDQRGRVTLYLPVLAAETFNAMAVDLGWPEPIIPHCSIIRSDDSDDLLRACNAIDGVVPGTVTLTNISISCRIGGAWREVA